MSKSLEQGAWILTTGAPDGIPCRTSSIAVASPGDPCWQATPSLAEIRDGRIVGLEV